jgi:hypothetical protein
MRDEMRREGQGQPVIGTVTLQLDRRPRRKVVEPLTGFRAAGEHDADGQRQRQRQRLKTNHHPRIASILSGCLGGSGAK